MRQWLVTGLLLFSPFRTRTGAHPRAGCDSPPGSPTTSCRENAVSPTQRARTRRPYRARSSCFTLGLGAFFPLFVSPVRRPSPVALGWAAAGAGGAGAAALGTPAPALPAPAAPGAGERAGKPRGGGCQPPSGAGSGRKAGGHGQTAALPAGEALAAGPPATRLGRPPGPVRLTPAPGRGREAALPLHPPRSPAGSAAAGAAPLTFRSAWPGRGPPAAPPRTRPGTLGEPGLAAARPFRPHCGPAAARPALGAGSSAARPPVRRPAVLPMAAPWARRAGAVPAPERSEPGAAGRCRAPHGGYELPRLGCPGAASGWVALPPVPAAGTGRAAGGRVRGHLQAAEERWKLEAVGPGPSSESELSDVGLGHIGSLPFKLLLCLPHSWLRVLTSSPGCSQCPFQPYRSLPVSEK